MSLSDDDIVGLVRDCVRSYTTVRRAGMRGIQGEDLLRHARKRFGDAITEEELDAAVVHVGGQSVRLTSTGEIPSRLRPPHSHGA
jgi:hypothetical protein